LTDSGQAFPAYIPHLNPQAEFDACLETFLFEHGDDRRRGGVAKQLTTRLLVPGDGMVAQIGQEVRRGEPCQGRSAEIRILGDEMLGAEGDIGKIASSSARDLDFRGQFPTMVEKQHSPSSPSRGNGAHHAGRSCSENRDVVIHRAAA